MNAPATLGESGQLSRGAPARARSDAAPRSAGWLASGELPTPPSSCGTSSRRSIGARGAPTTPSPSSPPLLRPYVDPLHVDPLLRRCVAAARPRPRACCGAAWPAAAALALAPRAASTRRATLDGLACRAPSSSTSLSPRGGDGPKTTLSHRCDRVGVRLRYVARWIRPAGREAHNMAKQPALSTGAPPVLVPAMVPAGGKSSRLWNPPA